MGAPVFNARLTPDLAVTPVSSGVFDIVGALVDVEGVFTIADAAIGDLIFLNGGAARVDRYSVTNITGVNALTQKATFRIQYADPGAPPANLDFAVLQPGFICRPQSAFALAAIPATATQNIPEKFGALARNSDLATRVGPNLGAGGSTSAAGITVDNTGLSESHPTVQDWVGEFDGRQIIFDEEVFIAEEDGQNVFSLERAATTIRYFLIGGAPQPLDSVTLDYPDVSVGTTIAREGMVITIGTAYEG